MFSNARTVGAIREAVRHSRTVLDIDPPPVALRKDITLPGGDGEIGARIYVPYGADENLGPGLVFFHGGGFFAGSVDGHEPLAQRLAAVSGVRVVSVEYRLAPEHKFPAPLDDALSAFDAIRAGALSEYGFDGGRLAVGGDSAGGTLSAVIAQERRSSVAFQLLLYPLLQLVEFKKPNARWQEGPLLSVTTLKEIRKHYLADDDPSDPRISPLYASDLKGLAPAYILTAEFDPLLDEANAYADRLSASAVPVELKHYKSVPHGFLSASRVLPACIPAVEAAGRALQKGLE